MISTKYGVEMAVRCRRAIAVDPQFAPAPGHSDAGGPYPPPMLARISKTTTLFAAPVLVELPMRRTLRPALDDLVAASRRAEALQVDTRAGGRPKPAPIVGARKGSLAPAPLAKRETARMADTPVSSRAVGHGFISVSRIPTRPVLADRFPYGTFPGLWAQGIWLY